MCLKKYQALIAGCSTTTRVDKVEAQTQEPSKLIADVCGHVICHETAENHSTNVTEPGPEHAVSSAGAISQSIISAPDLAKLEETLSMFEQTTVIFFDVDETLVLPRTAPFIYGTPSTDEFVNKWIKGETANSCFSVMKKQLLGLMEKEYNDTPMELVDAGLPALLRKLKAKGHDLYAITSRPANYVNNRKLLSQLRILFPSWPFNNVQQLTTGEVRGEVIFTDYGDKGAVMREIVSSDGSAVLVDNSISKCWAALNAGFDAVHFTEANNHGTEKSMRIALCGYMRSLGHDSCAFCEENEEDLEV